MTVFSLNWGLFWNETAQAMADLFTPISRQALVNDTKNPFSPFGSARFTLLLADYRKRSLSTASRPYLSHDNAGLSMKGLRLSDLIGRPVSMNVPESHNKGPPHHE